MVVIFALVLIPFGGGVIIEKVVFIVQGFAIVKNSGFGIMEIKRAFTVKGRIIGGEGNKSGNKNGKTIGGPGERFGKSLIKFLLFGGELLISDKGLQEAAAVKLLTATARIGGDFRARVFGLFVSIVLIDGPIGRAFGDRAGNYSCDLIKMLSHWKLSIKTLLWR